LKAVVLILAMLFEMTSTLVCWASMPVAAIERERMEILSVKNQEAAN
jgi:hypothetical protein